MSKLKLKETGRGLLILAGFFLVLTAVTWLFEPETAEAVRVVLLEYGAFAFLSAIVGGVIAQKSGFLPLYGIGAGITFVPFMLLFYAEKNFFVIAAYTVLGYIGVLIGYMLWLGELRRIQEGRPQKKHGSFLLKIFDRYNIKKYK